MYLSDKIEKIIQTQTAKKVLLSLLIGIAVTGFANQYAKDVKADISSNVVRFHVLANSDRDYDQQLKLKVRDGVIAYLEDKLDKAKSVDETKEILKNDIENIKTVSENIVKENGYAYSVDVVLGNFDFPTKKYGDSQFPAGKYDALRILIGNAEGQNWWCVLYPQLCFTQNTNGKMPDESRQKLKNVLNEDEYNIVTSPTGNMIVKFKFKILELFARG